MMGKSDEDKIMCDEIELRWTGDRWAVCLYNNGELMDETNAFLICASEDTELSFRLKRREPFVEYEMITLRAPMGKKYLAYLGDGDILINMIEDLGSDEK